MATEDATNTKQLPSFSNTRPFEQLAITLRAEGKKYDEITNTINAEYNLAYAEITVRQWLMTGGRLEQAFNEYNESMADAAVAEGKMKIKKLTATAAYTLEQLMGPANAGNVRQQAAKTILGKYIPDRQIIVDESKIDDVPEEIGAAGDSILKGEPDGQKPVDDSPEGAPAAESPRAGSDQAVPESVLPEQPATN